MAQKKFFKLINNIKNKKLNFFIIYTSITCLKKLNIFLFNSQSF